MPNPIAAAAVLAKMSAADGGKSDATLVYSFAYASAKHCLKQGRPPELICSEVLETFRQIENAITEGDGHEDNAALVARGVDDALNGRPPQYVQ